MTKNNPMKKSDLLIGTYILDEYARSERHIREIKECGIDFVVCMENDRPALDLFAKYGLGADVRNVLPGWWGGDGGKAGRMAEINPKEKYDEAMAGFVEHPAVWCLDVGDEPSALDFPYYGRVIDWVDHRFPDMVSYLNLYPNYASVSQNNADETVNQLGTRTYAEHIEEYCKYVPTHYICYDHYQYSANIPGCYENFRIVADACRRTGRQFWYVPQVNSNKPEIWLSLNMLRHQAYTAMAFGAVRMIWACYTAGWWHNQVLDDKGEKTQQYAKLQKVNGELKHLAPYYDRFRNVSTHFVGFAADEPDMSKLGQKPIETLNTGVFFDLRGDEGTKLVVGQMAARDESRAAALMLCNAGDPMDLAKDTVSEIRFKCYDRKVILVTGDGEETLHPDADGCYSFKLPMSNGAMLIAQA